MDDEPRIHGLTHAEWLAMPDAAHHEDDAIEDRRPRPLMREPRPGIPFSLFRRSLGRFG